MKISSPRYGRAIIISSVRFYAVRMDLLEEGPADRVQSWRE